MGSSDFGEPSLEIIHKKFNLVGVVTLKDRIKGRGYKPIPTPIKQKAKQLGIKKIIEIESTQEKSLEDEIKKLNPDIIYVVAFRILPKNILNIPKIGSINLHASLLPKYRGPAPINWAIINGENNTGLTTFFITEEVDAGNIILQKEYPINFDWDFGDLYYFLKEKSYEITYETLTLIEKGDFKLKEQDLNLVSYAPKIKKEDALIDFNNVSLSIYNKIRGVNPIPGAFVFYRNKILKIRKVKYNFDDTNLYNNPGEIIEISKEYLKIACKKGSIFIIRIQPEGKKEMKIKDFINGYKPKIGEMLKTTKE